MHPVCRRLRRHLLFTLFFLPSLVSAHDLEIHGSNTIGAALAPMLMTGFLEQLTGEPVTVSATGNANEAVLGTTRAGEPLTVLVAAHGTSTGFTSMAASQADIWAASRRVKTNEIEAMKSRADMTEPSSEHVIAIDGLAILVHPSNPVAQLSIETLARIFAGEITNWSAVSGPDRLIQVYARDDQSGTWDTFKELVLAGRYTLTGEALRYESNDELSKDVSRDPAGIGFAGFASAGNSKLLAIADGDAPALKPSKLSVATEDYPLSRRLYLYTPGATGQPLAQAFIEYAQSQAGQDIVAKSGFFSQNPFAVDPMYDAGVPDTFKRLTERYQRLSVNIRFAEGHTKLDNKANRDLLRVQAYLEQTGKTGRDLMLIGFADKRSDELRAQMVSELRARSASKALRELGTIVAGHTGYGHYMPVGSAGGDAGAQRNGRVEIWVRR
ncbi:phosphate ABC transporter substrate-binding protein, PhoT family [Halopseudomonas xinjiangensis]|uniref:Phosphate ABC transporter substrate-binding protein, PhoT family n=1 Tax=Halopseudomonas xinjiangensis TaxID=487184 RepID=A0A1H1T0B2_9GAMM|nr:substrate-binding domain-containing protein [Halopseudomonas xinjiangensis]SDS53705.1 phosphate ABC transporter substrate-binding protein, PhoT family [Halopseudomonas xinjiangensis]